MAPEGARITRDKRIALATCNGLLVRACDQLDEGGPEAALQVMRLRERRQRLIDELVAVVTEWAP